MQGTPTISIILFFVASLLGAIGQFFYKSGADAANQGFLSYLINWRLWIGVVCYIAVMILFISAFKKGGALSVLYPVYATTFIWAAGISFLAYGTEIKLMNVAGMALMVGGMWLMGK